jgi:transglutaminase-like putative cysteine protease
MKLFSSLVALVALSLSQVVPAAAEADDGPDLPSRISRLTIGYVLNDDGSFTETREIAVKALKETAVKSVKHSSVTFSTSIQKAEVLRAYTQKADGRTLDAPKANLQVEANSGQGQNAPAFSDLTTLSVVFPDVEIGDTVVFSYKITASEPIFPNHFSAQNYFPKTVAYDDVRIRIDAPAQLWTQHQARSLTEVTDTVANGRHVLEWTYANPNPIKNLRKNYSAYDIEQEPGFAFSTFRDHAQIAAAYGARAIPKAAPTERVQKLAAEIVGNRTNPREITKALYEWVATNITYAGNCIGIGAVVPRDLDVVLDNRMGDCKDHATLLQALLAAKGIDSTQALVNSGSAYRLPKIPLVSMVNHVINYIPAFDLYLDSTSNSTPFGILPFEDADKPVLWVQGVRDGSKTPADQIGLNEQTMKTTLNVRDDGSASGEVTVTLKGRYAADVRSRMKPLQKEIEAELVKNMFKEMGYVATGTFDKDDPAGLGDTYRYGAKFDVAKLVQYPGVGAFAINPLIFNEAPIWHYVAGALQNDNEAHEEACSNGRSIEEYKLVLPKKMQVLGAPENMKVVNDFLTYEATSVRKGNVLTVRRVLDDRTRGNLCSQQIADEYRKFANQVLPNLKAQVVFR